MYSEVVIFSLVDKTFKLTYTQAWFPIGHWNFKTWFV